MVLKRGDNLVEEFGKDGVVDKMNGKSDDRFCGYR